MVIAYILGIDLANSSLSRWIEEVANVELISDRNFVIAGLSVHPDYQRQGFGTLLLAAFKQVVLQQNSPGIYLLCEDELLAYFEMNGFVEQGIIEGERSSEFAFLMRWQNPYYQEEL
jgi:acetyltransferase, GNAT family